MNLMTLRSSNAAAAIGLSKYQSRYRLYREMVHGEREEHDQYTLGLMAFGSAHEPDAVGWAESVTGVMFFKTGDRQESVSALRYSATPDGDDLEESLLEVKCRQPGNEAYEVGDDSWNHHMVQIQLAMQVVGRKYDYFGCYRPDAPELSRLWRIHRSDEYWDAFKPLAEKFFRYLDGDEECPARVGRKPVMPEVDYDTIYRKD